MTGQNHVSFRSQSDEWETPQWLFDEVNKEFSFTLDACASSTNRKCMRFYSKEWDGLSQSWKHEVVWCNPPYSNVKDWVAKAKHASLEADATIVMLLPSRTDTRWFHAHVYNQAELRFLKGRLKFGGATNNAPFPSMLAIYRSEEKK